MTLAAQHQLKLAASGSNILGVLIERWSKRLVGRALLPPNVRF